MSYNDDVYKAISGTDKTVVHRATIDSCPEILKTDPGNGKLILLVGWPEDRPAPANTLCLAGCPSATDILRSAPHIDI